MNYFECLEQVQSQLAFFVNAVLVEKALGDESIKDCVAMHNEIQVNAKDYYSRAILEKGLKAEQSPTFSNVPSRNHKNFVDDHMEEIFQVLRIPTTQHEVYKFAGRLRGGSIFDTLTSAQRVALVEAPFFKNFVTKRGDWLARARNIVVIESSNLNELATVTQEEKDFAALFQFDWYYDYCDDSRSYRAGLENHTKATVEINAALRQNPALQKVLNAIAESRGTKPTFFTESPT